VKSEHYTRIKQLYDQVIDLPVNAREAQLRALEHDPVIISEVLALITAAEAETFAHLSTPLKSMLGSVGTPTLSAGDVLGAWRIEREIGQGGMGSVYLVERVDGHFKQTAALKFLKGLPSAERLDYFTRERQLLASLTHPNIARLLDGGATPSGQPYLVMEYIDGAHVDQYRQQNKLSVDATLRLFVSACDAVAFAHRQLIVHCDLKPSNILVNKDGRPILLDFGIATLIDKVAEGAALSEPRNSQAYTPRYSSPEQREGKAVSTVSDIYSLGILLGELLDTTLTQNAELAAIVRKASAADPANRYPSVDALTDDIYRYRSKLPVRAYPATNVYVAKKFVQRRWPLVLVAVVFVTTVAGFTLQLIAESQRARLAEQVAVKARDDASAERDRAQTAEQRAVAERDATKAAQAETVRERDRATEAEKVAKAQRDRAKSAEQQAVTDRNIATTAESAASQTRDFLVSVFKSSSPNAQSGDLRASALVAEAEARVEREMRGQPALQADLFMALADVQKNMGGLKQARDSYLKAIALERMQKRPLVLSQMLQRLALLDMSSFGGKDAHKLASEALALSEKHDKADSESLADSLRAVAYTTFDAEEAQTMYLRALAIFEKLDPQGAKTEATLVMLGHNARDLRKSSAAITYYRRALAIIEKKNGVDHPFSMVPVDGVAKALAALGKTLEAEANFRRNIALSEKLHGADNLTTVRYVAAYGSFLEAVGRPRDALAQNTRALAVFEKRLGREAPQFVLTSVQAAGVMRDLGNLHAAAVLARQTRQSAYKAWSAPHPALAIVERGVGRIFLDAGEANEGNQSLAAALEMLKQMHGESHFSVTEAAIELSIGLTMLGNVEQAALHLDRVGPAHSTLGKDAQMRFALSRGDVARARGRMSEALAFYRSAEKFASECYGAGDTRAWLVKLSRAELLAAQGTEEDRPQSKMLASQILAEVSTVLAPNAPVLEKLRQLQRP
jgi:eukaryotic-like serine/threonine-protein kinase